MKIHLPKWFPCILTAIFIYPIASLPKVQAAGTTYYVSQSSGNDAWDGLASSREGSHGPWKTLAKASREYSPGDSVRLKCGDTWANDTLRPTGSGTPNNPISIGSYETGNRPILDGLDDAQDRMGIHLKDVAEYRITGIEFTRYLTGIYAEYSDDAPHRKGLRIEGCYFHDSQLYQHYEDYPKHKIGLGICLFSHECDQKIVMSDVTIKSCQFRRLASGIWTNSPDNFNQAADNIWNFANMVIDGCTFEECKQWPLGLRGIAGGAVRNCLTLDVGRHNQAWNGVAGSMIARCKDFIFEDSEWGFISIGPPGKASSDGQAFDFECNNINHVMRRCLFHDTDGPGFLLCNDASGPGPEIDILLEDCVSNGKSLRVKENGYPKVEIMNCSAANRVTWKACRFYLSEGARLTNRPEGLTFTNCLIKPLGKACSTTNLALATTASASSAEPGHQGASAVDGSAITSWKAASSSDQWLQLDFGRPQTINEFRLREDASSSVTRYVIEYWDDREAKWIGSFNGLTIGPDFVAPIVNRTTSKVRLLIKKTGRGTPEIAEFEAYNDTKGEVFNASVGVASADVATGNLRCEYLKDPLGIDVVKPRLSWVIESDRRGERQTAYQVVVASTPELLARDEGDLWDSGKVVSDQSVQVEYAGKPLASRQQCFWKVRAWTLSTLNSSVSAWSKPALWTMGLLKPEDWQVAKWIGQEGPPPPLEEHSRLPARYLRREFVVGKAVERATAYFCGLGESDLYLNGQKVGDHERDPGMTMFSKRCLYVSFDVKSLLKQGQNSVGAILGNGRFFAPRRANPEAYMGFGSPRMILVIRIEYTDGALQNLVSDESWKVTDQGPLRANNEYDGEEYDARMEMPGWDRVGFDDSRWAKAQVLPSPGGRLESRMYEPMRITETFKPAKITNPDPGVFIVHFEKGFYGTVRLKVSGPAGTKVVMRSAFDLFPNGRFKVENNRSAKTTDIYILKGGGQEVWRPRFRGQGTRYVEVTGFPGVPQLENLDGLFMHDDIEETGTFECSNPLINQLNRLMRYDQLGQKQSHPKELERDERMGWLGGSGTYVVDESVHQNSAAFYAKWLGDARLEQNADGSISDVCPAYWDIRSGSLVWPADMILIPLALYEYYGDRRVLEENYDVMKKWVLYTMRVQKRDLTLDLDPYGDWCPIVETSKPLIGTAYLYNNCKQLSRVAGLLGKADDEARFADLAKKTGEAFNKRFFNPQTSQYQGDTQCSYILPLAFGLVPGANRQAVISNHVNNIMVVHKQHVSVGLVGMAWMMRVLNDIGRADVAYALASQKDKPSWGYMVAKDASGMWEKWNHDTDGPGMNGSGFLMLTGDLNAWFYQGLAGINPDPAQPGFKHTIIKPQPIGDLTYVKASYKSMHGLIVSNWRREGDNLAMDVVIPANGTATVWVPAKDAAMVTEGGKPTKQAEGVHFLRMEGGVAVFTIGAGQYNFRSIMHDRNTKPDRK